MPSSASSPRSTTALLTFIIKDSDGNVAHRIRYSNLNLARHSGLLRAHVCDHGRVTFDLGDLREHKYPLHDPEAFAQVIHWLAENCRLESLAWDRKQLQWDEDENSLVWRGWRRESTFGKPVFERSVPWAPLECHLKIGAEHAVSFDKALWMYMYMLQLRLDDLLKPTMLELRAALFEWLDGNVPEVSLVEALWLRFGKGKRDEELSRAGLRRLMDAMDDRVLSAEEYQMGEAFLSGLPAKLKNSTRQRQDSTVG